MVNFENGVTPINDTNLNKMQADLGLSSSTVYTWEKRGTTPKAETLQKFA